MGLFSGRRRQEAIPWDRQRLTPVVRCSICTGEQVAGFRDRETGKIEEIALIRDEKDLSAFKARYGITGEIEKVW